MARTALFILGMHRSGTSATGGVCALLGAHMGRDLLPAGADNEKGFWESRGVVRTNEEILASLHLEWDAPLPMPTDWLPATREKFGAETRQVLVETYGDAPLIGIKDPRLCRLAPLWFEAATALEFRIKTLLVLRHPLEVAESLATRNGFSIAHGCLLWVSHVREAISHALIHPHAILFYDELLQDWRASMRRVGDQLGIDWAMDGADARVNEFLEHGLRHHAVPPEITDPSPALELALDLYGIVLSWQRDGELNGAALAGVDKALAGLQELVVEGAVFTLRQEVAAAAKAPGEGRLKRDLLQRWLSLRPHEARARTLLARDQLENDETAAAIEYFQTVAVNAQEHHQLSLAFAAASRWDEAAEAAAKACEQDPARAIFHHHLGVMLGKANRPAEAAAALQRAVALDGGRAASHFHLALAQEACGQLQAALGTIAQAVSAAPDNPDYLFAQGRLLFVAEAYSEAEHVLKQAIAARPTTPAFHHRLAMTLNRQGRLLEALAAAQAAVRHGGGPAIVELRDRLERRLPQEPSHHRQRSE